MTILSERKAPAIGFGPGCCQRREGRVRAERALENQNAGWYRAWVRNWQKKSKEKTEYLGKNHNASWEVRAIF